MQALVIVIVHVALDASSTLGVSHPGGGGSGCGHILNAGGSGGRVVHAGCCRCRGGGGRVVSAGCWSSRDGGGGRGVMVVVDVITIWWWSRHGGGGCHRRLVVVDMGW